MDIASESPRRSKTFFIPYSRKNSISFGVDARGLPQRSSLPYFVKPPPFIGYPPRSRQFCMFSRGICLKLSIVSPPHRFISILMHFHIIFNRENAETDRKASIIFPIIYYCGNNTALSSANRRSRHCSCRTLNRRRRLSPLHRGR